MGYYCEANSKSSNNWLYRHEWRERSCFWMGLSRFPFPQFQQNTAGKNKSQNKTKQDAPRKGRYLTSGGLLPYSLPHANASSRPSPSSATCSCTKAVSIAGYITSFHWPMYSSNSSTGFVFLQPNYRQLLTLAANLPSKFNSLQLF